MDIPSWNRGWENHVREGKGKRGLESTSKCLICLVSHNRQLWHQVLGGPNVKISRGSPSSSFVFMSQPLWFLVIFTFLSSCFTLPPRSVGSTKRNYMGWKQKQVWGFILYPGFLNLLKILFSTLTHSLVVLAKKTIKYSWHESQFLCSSKVEFVQWCISNSHQNRRERALTSPNASEKTGSLLS